MSSVKHTRALTGPVPDEVEWIDASAQLPAFLRERFDAGMAEGVGWKFAPLRLFPDRHELSLDNDCILWDVPVGMARWLAEEDALACLLAEDVRACFGRFAPLCSPEPRNLGIRGLPPGFDLGAALCEVLEETPGLLSSELDEQGMQVAALSRQRAVHVVKVEEVSICSPFPPHLPTLGRCGAHFCGLNARRLPWRYDDRPAEQCVREHWERHRLTLYSLVGLPPPREPLDVLLDPEQAPRGAEVLLSHLAQRRERWDMCDFEQLRAASPLLRVPLPPGWTESTQVQEACPVVSLPCRWEALPEVISPRLLANLRYGRRRLERLGPVSLELAEEGSLDELMEALVRLHGVRWGLRGQPGVLADGALREFHREVARGLLAVGALRLYVLRVGGEPVAVCYGFRDRDRASYYLGGFEPAYQRFSVGSIVVGHALEEAARSGATVFDFLRGREAYKYAWGARDALNYRRQLWPGPRPSMPAEGARA